MINACTATQLLNLSQFLLRRISASVLRAQFPSRHFTHRTMAESRATLAAKAALASVDLSNYDPEQSRLMSERCILVDEQDNAIGAMDKKTCMLSIKIQIFLTFTYFSLFSPGHLMQNINKGLLHRAFSAFVFWPSDARLLFKP